MAVRIERRRKGKGEEKKKERIKKYDRKEEKIEEEKA